MPARIVNADVTLALTLRDAQPGQVGENPVSHEGTHAHGSVVGAGHGVADSRIDPPHAESIRQRGHSPWSSAG